MRCKEIRVLCFVLAYSYTAVGRLWKGWWDEMGRGSWDCLLSSVLFSVYILLLFCMKSKRGCHHKFAATILSLFVTFNRGISNVYNESCITVYVQGVLWVSCRQWMWVSETWIELVAAAAAAAWVEFHPELQAAAVISFRALFYFYIGRA